MKIDLHMHSYASDGTLDAKGLLAKLEEQNIKLFALTDHDTIACIDEMKEAIKGKDIFFIPGVEIATSYQGKEYHLTCYGYETSKGFTDLLDNNLDIRYQFDIEIITALALEHESVTLEEFLDYDDDPYNGGWLSYNYLKSKGLLNCLQDYFDLTRPLNKQMVFPSPKTVVEAVHKAGGYVFVAHPAARHMDESHLDDFRSYGVDGVECFTPYNKDQAQAQFYIDYCNKHGLKISGGSDYHGPFVERAIGNPAILDTQISFEFFKSIAIKG